MSNSTLKTVPNSQTRVCSECGQIIKNETTTSLMECDRCLSKKPE